jgi:hypothetical protein
MCLMTNVNVNVNLNQTNTTVITGDMDPFRESPLDVGRAEWA